MLKNILKFTIASVLAFGFNACNDSKEVKDYGGVEIDKEGRTVKVDGKLIEYKGLRIFGLDGSQKYSRGPHQYTEQEMNGKILKNLFYFTFF